MAVILSASREAAEVEGSAVVLRRFSTLAEFGAWLRPKWSRTICGCFF